MTIAATDNITVNSFINASGNTKASDLTLTAPLINLNASITNRGSITFNGAVASTAPVDRFFPSDSPPNSISTTGTGNITFTSSIDSPNTSGLSLDAAGDVSLLGSIGRTNPLRSLNIRANNVALRDYPGNSVTVNSNGNLNIQTQANLTVQGNSSLQAQGDLTLKAQGTLTLADSQLYSLGNMQLLGQGEVRRRESNCINC